MSRIKLSKIERNQILCVQFTKLISVSVPRHLITIKLVLSHISDYRYISFPIISPQLKGDQNKDEGSRERGRVKVTMHLSMMQMVAFIRTAYKLNQFPFLCYMQIFLLNLTPQDVYISKHSVRHQGSLLRLMLHPYGLSRQSVSMKPSQSCFYNIFLCKDVVIGKFLNNFNKHGIFEKLQGRTVHH